MKILPKSGLFNMEHEASESDRRKRRILGLWLILLPLMCWAFFFLTEYFRPTSPTEGMDVVEPFVFWNYIWNSLGTTLKLSLPTAVCGVLLRQAHADFLPIFLASLSCWTFTFFFTVSCIFSNMFAYTSLQFSLMRAPVILLGVLGGFILGTYMFSLKHPGAALLGLIATPPSIMLILDIIMRVH